MLRIELICWDFYTNETKLNYRFLTIIVVKSQSLVDTKPLIISKYQ